MKLAKILMGLTLVVLVGGFAWLAVADIPVPQSPVTKTISNERFFDAD